MAKGKRAKYILIALGLVIALVFWLRWENTALELDVYTLSRENLPAAFDGFRIAQVSDLHNAQMGKNNEDLLAMLRGAAPDIIALTGDLVDSRHPNMDVALQFVREAVEIAPCFYVTGNHEARLADFGTLKAGLEAAGVTVLENSGVELERSGEQITVLGVEDPAFWGNGGGMEANLKRTLDGRRGFLVLLSHRPELFEKYADSGVDLVLTGHAHGGQIRLPFIGGLVAPNQGLFPKYDAGLFTRGGTRMIVSRGLGNSILPQRLLNRPEVVLVELRRA